MTAAIDVDHTSFAVDDAMGWARRLRRDLGATPIAGEALTDFRYLLLYIGTAHAGARLELLEPAGHGFLTRFLDRHGAGPHHITFTVPDLPAAVRQVKALGATVVGEDYSHASWREAFILPDEKHGVVIQLAQTDLSYPRPSELLATSNRDTDAFPSSRGATDPRWWAPIWDTPPGARATLGATHLASTDLDYTRALFGGVLGASVTEGEGNVALSWSSGSILVHSAAQPGVVGMDLRGGPADGVRIGPALLAEHVAHHR